MKKSIIAMGDGLWDMFPSGPLLGGATANFACHASRLGGEIYMVSGVGQDKQGEELLQMYHNHGVRTELVEVLEDYPTGVVTVKLSESGMPAFTIGADAAWDYWSWNSMIERKVKQADALYFGTLGQRGQSPRDGIRKALGIAMNDGKLRVLDINLRAPFFDHALIRESINLCSVLKLSDEEIKPVLQACEIDGSKSEENGLRELQVKFELDIVAMTKGAEGAILLHPGGIVEHPGFPATVVDTVGAGDSFTASMTIGLLEGKGYADIVVDACKVAAGVCSHAGAAPR
jgi:fructokinase